MKSVVVTHGQTLIDIAIQELGCYEGVFVVMDYNDISITSEFNGRFLEAGDVLDIPTPVPQITANNQTIAAYFKANGIRVNSGFKPTLLFDGDYEPDDFEPDDYL